MRHAGTCAALAAAALLAGCGSGSDEDTADLPPNAVARVGDTVLTKGDFFAKVKTFQVDRASMDRKPGSGVYDPPGFEQCVAGKKAQPSPRDNPDKHSDADLKKECEDEFKEFKTKAMKALVAEEWIRQEAKTRGINLTDADVERRFEEFMGRAGASKKAEYRQFLKKSGQTREDVLTDIRNDQLEGALAEKVMDRAKPVTDADVERYYEKHRDDLRRPETRDIDVVLARSEEKASGALRALRGGATWEVVAKRYSIDDASKKTGGRLERVEPGEQDEELEKAAFAADEGSLEGPIESQFGWYVFEVAAIHPPEGPTLEEARAEIRRKLRKERRQKELDEFNARFGEKYQAITVCAEGFEVGECRNG
jgi:parvulin-like peptidyl-prolyl isomerase